MYKTPCKVSIFTYLSPDACQGMAARLNSNEGNDSPLIGAAQIGKTVFESRCSQALDEARLRESWGQVSRKRQSTIDHASIDSSSIHDREGIGIESR